MKGRNFDNSSRRQPGFDASALNDLDVAYAPDLTRRIMGRLGYMQVSPRIARRRRMMRWASRAGVCMAAALAIGIGLHVYENTADLRQPEGATIPAAITIDLQTQQHRLGSVIQTIRNLSTETRPQDSIDLRPFEAEMLEFDALDDDLPPASLAFFRWV
jgi:hypothetical protein